MPYEILFRESVGLNGPDIVYVKPPESHRICRLNSSLKTPDGYFQGLINVLKEVFLPHGFPYSVSDDYTEYQIWDTIQAFCSTISNILTTEAIMKGVGVGNVAASSLSAAVTWVLKDGSGMISKILFAWLSGSGFDSDCKKWRLFADVLNDAAMLLELSLLPFYTESSLQILCITTSMKAIVGVAGGATRAAVTQHQAIMENMGDVSAKDGSQETCVNLIASFIGIFLLSSFNNSRFIWFVFLFVTILHIYSNYRAVRSLKFFTFNPERFHIVLYNYLTTESVPSQREVAWEESVLIFGGLTDSRLCGYEVRLGSSLKGIPFTSNQLKLISNIYKNREFLLVQSSNYVHVALSKSHTSKDLIQGYFHALVLGIATSFANGKTVSRLNNIADIPKEGLLSKLIEITSKWEKKDCDKLNIEELIQVDQLCTEVFEEFMAQLKSKCWNCDIHQLHPIDWRWRASWGTSVVTNYPTTDKSHLE